MGGGRERRRPEATPRRRESSGVDAGTETRETPPAMPTADKVYTLKDVSSHDFVVEYAQHLKKTGNMDVPKWVDIAKTGP